MRATPAENRPATPASKGAGEPADTVDALAAMLERIVAERLVCEKLDDPALVQRAERNVLTAVACAADAILADAKALQSAPDKVAAFFDKSATACVAAIDGLHKRAALAAADDFTPGPRGADAQENAISPWGLAAQRWRPGRTDSAGSE